eukprot:498426-Hanusia_phi.AAC.2
MPDTCCTGECCGEGLHGRNRTCIFRDLVYHNKDFSLFRSNIETDFQDRHMTFLVTRGPCRKHVCKNLSDPWMWQKPFVPRQRSESQSEPNLAKMCSNVVGISFYIAGCTSFNFGHAMWDCLYPAFLSMTLTGVVRAPWNVDFRLVFSGNDDFVDLRSKLFMEVFSGKEILELKKIVSNKCLRFEYMVVGIGDKGHMTRNEYYESQLYARHYLDDSKSVSPLHIFRKRLFCRYQLPVPERRFCEFKQTCVINVTVIRNKRFFTDLDGLCRVVNGVTNWSSLNRSNILFRCTILDWAVQRSLKEQLKFLSWQNIYYSSVGTALMSQAFLPYGSVVVNTGYLNGFWEDFHTAAIPWLQAVYPSRFGPVTVPEALDLIRKASSVWLSRFESQPHSLGVWPDYSGSKFLSSFAAGATLLTASPWMQVGGNLHSHYLS